ncbi:MAG TPA: hypothetical protein PLI65_04680 [Bacteroidales bacterium]|nr:hypothetical protein [Bacteroidales bacterium]HPR57844.1 hypothetical protein [Bacteroidales bacterium]HRW96045.1 hypothetical protein [Bacteroidales bacterium]
MKIKLNNRFLVLPLLAFAMLFALNQCKNVGPTEWPEPESPVLNQLKITAIDNATGESLQGFNIKLVLPDGSIKEFTQDAGVFTYDGTIEGMYVITVSKDDFLAENAIVEVSPADEELVSTVTQEVLFLNKRSEANLVTPQGTILYVDSDSETPTSIAFPYGSLSEDQNVSVTFIQPPAKHEELKVVGERVILSGYHFAPDLSFPENAMPVVTIPINIPSVTEGTSDIWFGTYDEATGTWEKIQGTLNEDRTLASFEMPHFSTWFVFTGYRLIKDVESWSPWTFVAESPECSAGVCGTFIYAVTPNALVNQLISMGYNINLKAKDTRCVGPHYKYAQILNARVLVVTYKVYDYAGVYVGSIQVPTKKFQWMVDEWYCHDQGGSNP